MPTVAKGIFGEWLDRRYVAWQNSEGGSRTMGEFAEFLEFPRETVSRWANGKKKPNERFVADKLANKLGDEVYDVLGMEPTDPRLRKLNLRWPQLSEAKKNEIHEVAERGAEYAPRKRIGRKAKAGQ